MKKIRNIFLLIAIISFTATAYAQPGTVSEHPPHHHPTKEGAQIPINNFKKAVENYVQKESDKNGGYFIVHDKKQDKDLHLKFVKMMPEDLSALGDNKYFVCSDYKGKDGNDYDIDIIMQGKSADSLKAIKKYVHKVNGNARFEWVEQKDKTWKREPVKSPKSKAPVAK